MYVCMYIVIILEAGRKVKRNSTGRCGNSECGGGNAHLILVTGLSDSTPRLARGSQKLYHQLFLLPWDGHLD